MDINIALTAISIGVGIIIAIIPFLWKKYFARPELTIELLRNGSSSFNSGISNKNDVSKGYIDGNNAIYIFNIKWKFKIIIRNNSENIAFYPKLTLDTTNPKFTMITPLNELTPISMKEPVVLEAEYFKLEECKGQQRTDAGKFPEDLENMKLLLEYKNASKITRFTLYSHSDLKKNIFLTRKPNIFRDQI